MPSRPASSADVARVTETLTVAFATDPVWGVALARPDGSTAHHTAYWNLFVEGALRYSTVFVADDDSAVALSIRPAAPSCRTTRTRRAERSSRRRSNRVPRRACSSSGIGSRRTTRTTCRTPISASWRRTPTTAARGSANGSWRRGWSAGMPRPPGLPGVDESRQRPPVQACRVPPDRRLHGHPRRRADLDDVASPIR